ncbi:MAG TPA: hypothetical protein VHL59_08820 [Thermoanaerobaculia bacterium]|nr:hypothetical protein [Thermoanaerobaculia bacterium]
MRLRIAAALIVIFAFSICCSGATAAAAAMTEGHGCCERECARASAERSCAFIAPEKREGERPPMSVATLPDGIAPDASVSVTLLAAGTPSRLFHPLTTVQLRI